MAHEALDSLRETLNRILLKSHDPDINQEILSIQEEASARQLHLKNLQERFRDAAAASGEIIEYLFSEDDPLYGGPMKPTMEHLNQLRQAAQYFKSTIGGEGGSINTEQQLKDASPSVRSSSSKDVVVGLDEDLKEMKKRLTRSGQPSQLQVLSIVGTGGIGKTTLAKLIYNDESIVNHFRIRAWVTVSQDYSVGSIVYNLLTSLEEGGIPVERDGQREISIPSLIQTHLNGGKFLIVIDDLCSKKAWDDVKTLFPNTSSSSRIMLTTRLQEVADYVNSSIPTHSMRLLDAHHSWDLLKKKVFVDESCPIQLEDVGRKIVKICRGLPLAIVMVAGILSKLPKTRYSWKEYAADHGTLETIIQLSYNHLPHHMRECFLYMGGFPEDYKIRVSELIKLWISEGFLKFETRSMSLEKEAAKILDDMVERNLVIVSRRKFDGKIKSCILHDIVRDFCIREAQRKKFLLSVMDYLPTPILRRHFLPRLLETYGRISVSSHDLNLTNSSLPTRSIICIPQGGYKCVSLMSKFSSLKVFHVLRRNNNWKWEPSQVLDLMYLTYLASNIPTGIVPSTILKFENLQTLNIYRYEVGLPVEIWKLRQLKHLMALSFASLPQPNMETRPLEKLKVMSLVIDLMCRERMMAMIPNIRKLGICCKSFAEFNIYNLEYLHQLEKLKWVSLEKLQYDSRLKNTIFPPSLKKLTLCGLRLPWENMRIIGSLPGLQVLKLRNYACDDTIWGTTEGEFKQLEFLLVDESNLLQWRTRSSHFPRLRSLVLRRCPDLREVPHDIGNISTLEFIQVDVGNKFLLDSAKIIREDQKRKGNYNIQVCYSTQQVSDSVRPSDTEEKLKQSRGAADYTPLSVDNEDALGKRQAIMVDTAMESLLNNLKELLVYHSHLISDKRSEIKSLEQDLRLCNMFLKDSVKRRREDERAKELVCSILDVVYEVEDVIDAFVTRALEKKIKAGSVKPFLKFWEPSIDLHDIGKKVEVVKQKVEQVDFGTPSFDDDDDFEKPEVPPPRQKDVVGFEDITTDLILQLTQETDYLDVISLIGMFGLGKTTLAWKIFNHPEILFHFPRRIWLAISKEFSLKDIFLAILKEFTTITDDMRQKHEYELAKMVTDKLEASTFFIVMDDVWSRDDWDKLRYALPNNKNGKVLITSNIEEVGCHASCPRDPHKLRFFNQDESWELLRLEALRTLDCPFELEGVGKLIASGCRGLPLAVVVIGGILATKCSASNRWAMRSTWEEVSKQVGTYLTENDPACHLNNFISLSYDKLPHHLRACFLFLGMFPEDYEIPAWQLIQMWIGEGFIRQNTDPSSLEEIAEKYLHDLVNRNLVRVHKFKPDGKVKTCQIHDTVRDFCRTEAEHENENFFREIKYENGNFMPQVSDLNKYRRLSIHSNCQRFVRSKPVGHRARTFVCFSKDEFILPEENIPDILTAFKLLRVIDVKPIKFPKLNINMYQLVHLRYIVLSLNLSILPSKFSELWNIQTLIVDTTSRTLEVKANIWKMSQLRHFETNASAKLPKQGKDSKEGAELQTLGTISVESCTAEVFDRACNLKKLGIRGRLSLLLEGNTGSFGNLAKMKYLEKLKLLNDVYPLPLSEGQLNGLPQPYQFPKRLRSLTLRATLLDWSNMSILGFLENLEVLKLKHNAFMGKSWNAVDGGFRKLIYLHVEHKDLVIWNAASHHFPRLRSLVLKNCERLLGIPIGLADITSFQMLDLYVCTHAGNSAKKIQDVKREKQAEFKLSIFPPDRS